MTHELWVIASCGGIPILQYGPPWTIIKCRTVQRRTEVVCLFWNNLSVDNEDNELDCFRTISVSQADFWTFCVCYCPVLDFEFSFTVKKASHTAKFSILRRVRISLIVLGVLRAAFSYVTWTGPVTWCLFTWVNKVTTLASVSREHSWRTQVEALWLLPAAWFTTAKFSKRISNDWDSQLQPL